ncbi:MAG: hypothetical protein N3D73_00005, partial [Candidatus Diapherotrites archaeon]|nr:hypothetical protein [Candidatus Diapherotrites archaeon]
MRNRLFVRFLLFVCFAYSFVSSVSAFVVGYDDGGVDNWILLNDTNLYWVDVTSEKSGLLDLLYIKLKSDDSSFTERELTLAIMFLPKDMNDFNRGDKNILYGTQNFALYMSDEPEWFIFEKILGFDWNFIEAYVENGDVNAIQIEDNLELDYFNKYLMATDYNILVGIMADSYQNIYLGADQDSIKNKSLVSNTENPLSFMIDENNNYMIRAHFSELLFSDSCESPQFIELNDSNAYFVRVTPSPAEGEFSFVNNILFNVDVNDEVGADLNIFVVKH